MQLIDNFHIILLQIFVTIKLYKQFLILSTIFVKKQYRSAKRSFCDCVVCTNTGNHFCSARTATSSASSIICEKLLWRASESSASPVKMWSETVQIASAFFPLYAAFI